MFKFTAEMFEDVPGSPQLKGCIAARANELLEAELGKCERAYRCHLGTSGRWTVCKPLAHHNRTALLFNVEPIGEGEK